jgi:hypothetical protein
MALADQFTGLTRFDTNTGIAVIMTSHDPSLETLNVYNDKSKAIAAYGSGISVTTDKVDGTGNGITVHSNTKPGSSVKAVDATADQAVVAHGTSVGVDSSATKTAVQARSYTGYGAELAGAKAPLRLDPGQAAGAPTSGPHQRGELYVDSQGHLFLCLADGTPGTWREVALK